MTVAVSRAPDALHATKADFLENLLVDVSRVNVVLHAYSINRLQYEKNVWITVSSIFRQFAVQEESVDLRECHVCVSLCLLLLPSSSQGRGIQAVLPSHSE